MPGSRMRATKMMRLAVVIVAGTVILGKKAGTQNGWLIPRRPVNRKSIAHPQRGIEGTPGPPAPKEIRRRWSFTDEHGGARAIGNIRDARSGTFVDHSITRWPR